MCSINSAHVFISLSDCKSVKLKNFAHLSMKWNLLWGPLVFKHDQLTDDYSNKDVYILSSRKAPPPHGQKETGLLVFLYFMCDCLSVEVMNREELNEQLNSPQPLSLAWSYIRLNCMKQTGGYNPWFETKRGGTQSNRQVVKPPVPNCPLSSIMIGSSIDQQKKLEGSCAINITNLRAL